MLQELRIRDLAVIERAAVRFERGLNVLTGETGAGKSILVDAILLLSGGRPQAEAIRTEAEAAVVEAVYSLEDGEAAARILDDAGLTPEDGEIVIRREVSRAGRHRAFVNDSPVTVGLLERIGAELIEVHGQHEHQGLLDGRRQAALLDRFGGHQALAEEVAARFAAAREAREDLDRLRAAERDRAQRQDLLRFQVSELDAARLRAGEEEELRAERRRLQHGARIGKGLEDVLGWLHDDPQAARARLAQAIRGLGELVPLVPACTGPLEMLESAEVQMDEVVRTLRTLRQGIGEEPGRLEAIDERLDALTRLGRKYGDTVEAMLSHRAEAARELDRLERYEETVAEAEGVSAAREARLLESATALSGRRTAAAGSLATTVERELRALGMDRARFEVSVTTDPGAPYTARGLDRVEFRFSANPGEEPRPLLRVASGGEMSRVMLALQTVVAGDGVPTMIFDEVDAGIGGRTAAVVGEKLAALARGRQVLCVTHLPQIAAWATRHVRVTKSVRAGRTRAAVSVLEHGKRAAELARMLGGDGGSDLARRHAEELLARARRG